MARKVCERLAEGETLRAICRDPEMPARTTIHKWIIEDVDGFAGQYARARDVGLDEMADETIEISDDGANDTYLDDEGNRRPDTDVLGRSKIRVDTRKWYLSKLAPKRYGERTQVATTDAEGNDVAPTGDLAFRIASVLDSIAKRDAGDLA